MDNPFAVVVFGIMLIILFLGFAFAGWVIWEWIFLFFSHIQRVLRIIEQLRNEETALTPQEPLD